MSNKYWTDKQDEVDVVSAVDINNAYDGIATDIEDITVNVSQLNQSIDDINQSIEMPIDSDISVTSEHKIEVLSDTSVKLAADGLTVVGGETNELEAKVSTEGDISVTNKDTSGAQATVITYNGISYGNSTNGGFSLKNKTLSLDDPDYPDENAWGTTLSTEGGLIINRSTGSVKLKTNLLSLESGDGSSVTVAPSDISLTSNNSYAALNSVRICSTSGISITTNNVGPDMLDGIDVWLTKGGITHKLSKKANKSDITEAVEELSDDIFATNCTTKAFDNSEWEGYAPKALYRISDYTQLDSLYVYGCDGTLKAYCDAGGSMSATIYTSRDKATNLLPTIKKAFDTYGTTDVTIYVEAAAVWYVDEFVSLTPKEYTDSVTGDLSALTTTDKTNLVNAINEVSGSSSIDGITLRDNGTLSQIEVSGSPESSEYDTTTITYNGVKVYGQYSDVFVGEGGILVEQRLNSDDIKVIDQESTTHRLTEKADKEYVDTKVEEVAQQIKTITYTKTETTTMDNTVGTEPYATYVIDEWSNRPKNLIIYGEDSNGNALKMTITVTTSERTYKTTMNSLTEGEEPEKLPIYTVGDAISYISYDYGSAYFSQIPSNAKIEIYTTTACTWKSVTEIGEFTLTETLDELMSRVAALEKIVE